ncbi:HNH endonuclease signature motif containing protein [Blastococcus sp. PRF04-17]|uniref:HNH endonuclease signature motif containing protein n=1 Tax=Blastococcus sp. PRF04-17 TaxID=2933797 RepID=UPI001FF39166|nr:HNH endonuclease signature motif containing protein [Blastococcus sp. PRF04-17]UOY03804.1 HNH endonuclease [Blastococcus sp. PRF04-17]
MFPGSSYGVAVTVARLHAPSAELMPAVPGERDTRLDELLPAESLTDAELAREIDACTRIEARLAAYKADRIAQLAARRSAARDRQPGQPGAAPQRDERLPDDVSEFFPDELAMILNCSRTAATVQTEVSLTLRHTLTRTWVAMTEGRIDPARGRALALELGAPARDTDPLIIAAVESAMLPVATTMSVKRLRAETRKELVARDAAAADRRRRQAARAADVVVRHLPDGISQLVHTLPTPLANAQLDAYDRYARMVKSDGDERSLGQLRSMVAVELALRPWDTTRPPVTASLTVLAPLGALQGRTGSVADLDGQAITADHVRELLAALDALTPDGLRAPAGGSVTVGVIDSDGALRAVATPDELRRLARRGCREHPDDASCGCSVLDRPPPVDRYRPSRSQDRWVRTRDRGCRHPGCDNRAGWADLDHVVPHACGGSTDCANLCCLCRRHHRLKTFAPGWRFVMEGDGTLSVTTPSGVTRSTRPPGLPALAEYWPVPSRELVQPEDDDPPPF